MKLNCSKSLFINNISQYILLLLFLLTCTLMASFSTSLMIKKSYKENLSVEIKNNLHNKLNEVIDTFESSLDQVLTLSCHALYNSLYNVDIEPQKYDVQSNTLSGNSMSSNHYLIYTTIRNICKASNLVESVCFYDQPSGYMFDSQANICLINNYFDRDINELFQYNTDIATKPIDNLGCYYRLFQRSLYDQSDKQYMTVIYSYKNIRHIAINIDLVKYYKTSFEKITNSLDANLIFVDNNREMLISSLDAELASDIMNLDFSSNSNQSYKFKNGESTTVIDTKSNKYDFHLFGIIKQSVLDQMISKSLNTIFLLQFIVFFVYTNFFMLFVILFLRPIIKSIKAILDQGNEVVIPTTAIDTIPEYKQENRIKNSNLNIVFSIDKLLNTLHYKNLKLNEDVRLFLPIYTSKLLANLLTEKVENAKQVILDLKDCGFVLPYNNNYYAAAIEINYIKNEGNVESISNISLYKQFVIKSCNELFNNYEFGFAVDLNDNIIGLAYSSEYGKNAVIDFLANIRTSLLSKYEIYASIAIGPQVENISALSTSFSKAQNALNYRITFDTDEIIDAEKFQIDEFLLTEYYCSIKEVLLRYISSGDTENACLMIDALFNYIKTEKYRIGFQEVVDMSINLIQSVAVILYDNDINVTIVLEKPQYEIYNQINYFTRSSLHRILSGITLRAACCFEIDEVNFINKSLFIVKKACDFINENYTNDISLENVANYIGLNASYFSKLFKDATGITFVKYLEKQRMEEAIKLIRNTNMMISEIGIKVGYNSPNYFSRVFKRFTGLTPDNYRQRYNICNN